MAGDRRHPVVRDADAVVDDAQLEAAVAGAEGERDVGGPGVLADVEEGLLGDPVGHPQDRGRRAGRAVGVALDHAHLGAAAVEDLAGGLAQRGGEPVVEVDRGEVEQQRAQPVGRLRDGGAERVDVLQEVGRLRGDPSRQQPQAQVDRGQGLDRVVVDLGGDVGPLGVLGVDQAAEQVLALLGELAQRLLGRDPVGEVALDGRQREGLVALRVTDEEAGDLDRDGAARPAGRAGSTRPPRSRSR